MEKQKMRVIINADDFGYNSDVNKAIKEAIESHVISSSTIMANAPAFEQAIDIAKFHNEISFGVHLNIVEFHPLTNKDVFHKYGMTDELDNFIEGAAFAIENFTDELKLAIKQEWIAQIQKVSDAGISISHINSHQHTHTIPQLRDVLIDVMKSTGINKCRNRQYFSLFKIWRSRKYKNPKYDKSNVVVKPKSGIFKKLKFHLFDKPLRHYLWVRAIKKNFQITDDLVSYQFFLQDFRYHRNTKFKTIELECHPGLIPNKEETSLLMNDELRKLAPDYCLINYYQL